MKAKDFLGRLVWILGIVLVLSAMVVVRVGAAATLPAGSETQNLASLQMAQVPQTAPAVPPVNVTPEALAAIAGAVLSLAFSYIPGLNTNFAGLSSEAKRGIMAGLLLLAAAAIYGLGCGGIVVTGITCDQDGAVRLVYILIVAVMANQSTFTLSPVTTAVKIVKTPQP